MKKVLFCIAALCAAATGGFAQSFSAATYNVRQLNAGDDARGDGWERRLPVIASLIRYHDFDIFGAQEVFHSQLAGSSRGASRLRLHRRRTRRRGRGGRICGGVLQERPFPTARLGAFLAFGGTLASEQGLGCQICPHLLLGPVPRSGERRAVLVLHAPYRSQGPSVRRSKAVGWWSISIRTMCRGERAVLTGDFNVGETSESYAVLRDSGLAVRRVATWRRLRYA